MGWDKLATTAYVDAQVTAEDLDVSSDSGTIAIDLDSETFTISGGTGITTSATGNALTITGSVTQTTVDDALSSSSANAVENHVVYDALALKQPLDAQLTTLAGFTAAQVVRGIADDNLMTVDDADAANADYAKFTANGLEGRDFTQVRTDLGLTVGSDVQAFGAVLDDINTLGVVGADGEVLIGTGPGALAWEKDGTLRTSIGLGTGNSPTFTDLKLSGGDLTFQGSAGALSASDVTTGTGYKVSVHGGDGKAGIADLSAGALELAGGQGTGDGAGGDIVFRVSPVGASGTAQNAYQTALTISDDKSATFTGTIGATGAITSSAGITGTTGTFSSNVSIAGNLDVNGTTTTIESTNTAIVDPAIVLNKTKDADTFGSGNAAIIFGDSNADTDGGKIVNNAATGFQFTDCDGGSANIPSDGTINSATAGSNYKDIYVKAPVLKQQSTTKPGSATVGMLYMDTNGDLWIGS